MLFLKELAERMSKKLVIKMFLYNGILNAI